MTYTVSVKREGVISVNARNAAEAKRKALCSIDSEVSWDRGFDVESVSAENEHDSDLTIEKAKEILRALTPWETRTTDSGGVVQGAV